MSEYPVTVSKITEINPCENADSLESITIDGYNCVVRKNDFKVGDLAAFVPPDSLVDTTKPEFSFLADGKHQLVRISAKKLRGNISVGLLIHAPQGSVEGDDVAEQLGVEHWNPPEPGERCVNGKIFKGECIKGPAGFWPKYDIQNFRKYNRLFTPGEPVYISEKIHGCFSQYVYTEGQMHVRSHHVWKKDSEDCLWWRILRQYPQIEMFCMEHPGYSLKGEIYGQVQNLKYGSTNGQVWFAAFDIATSTGYLNPGVFMNMCDNYKIPRVPVIAVDFPYDYDKILEMAKGNSLIPGANNIREGCVVKPQIERVDSRLGRVFLKCISPEYLLLKQ